MTTPRKKIKINAARIDSSIEQLQQHLGEDDIASLLAVLEAMKRDPQDSALIEQLSGAFNDLGTMQGAVLTYAPYLAVILSDDPLLNPA